MDVLKAQVNKMRTEQLQYRKKSIMMITSTDRASLVGNMSQMLKIHEE